MTRSLHPLTGRYWRMLNVRWQSRPFESGAHVTGGRWNAPGTPALYLSADYNTAIEEMHQDLVRPGTLVAFDIESPRIADLTEEKDALTACDWRRIFKVDGGRPPTWDIAAELIAAGAEGALVPSVQKKGGTNLVLWRWHRADGPGEGAALTLLDPERALTAR